MQHAFSRHLWHTDTEQLIFYFHPLDTFEKAMQETCSTDIINGHERNAFNGRQPPKGRHSTDGHTSSAFEGQRLAEIYRDLTACLKVTNQTQVQH